MSMASSPSSSTHYLLNDGKWLCVGQSGCACNPDDAEKLHTCTRACSTWACISEPPGPPKAPQWVRVRSGTVYQLIEHRTKGGEYLSKIIADNIESNP